MAGEVKRLRANASGNIGCANAARVVFVVGKVLSFNEFA
jgi:hypothetical protein